MPLTILTTTACSFNKSFHGALMVDSSFLRPHVIKCVQGVIEAMSSSSASACALALVDLQQRLGDRVEWIFGWMGRSIIDQAFDQALSDHPDLRDAVKAQVSVLCQSFK